MRRGRSREDSPVTQTDVLVALADAGGHMTALVLGEALWPEMESRGAAQGGPTSHQFVASCMLGKLAKKGYVAKRWSGRGKGGPSRPGGWEITVAGTRVVLSARTKGAT